MPDGFKAPLYPAPPPILSRMRGTHGSITYPWSSWKHYSQLNPHRLCIHLSTNGIYFWPWPQQQHLGFGLQGHGYAYTPQGSHGQVYRYWSDDLSPSSTFSCLPQSWENQRSPPLIIGPGQACSRHPVLRLTLSLCQACRLSHFTYHPASCPFCLEPLLEEIRQPCHRLPLALLMFLLCPHTQTNISGTLPYS